MALTRLAAALARFWYVRGYVSEGRAWLEEAATRDVGSPSVRAKVLFGLSILLDSEGEYAQAIDAGLASVELYRELDPEGLADALNNLGNAAGNWASTKTPRSTTRRRSR